MTPKELEDLCYPLWERSWKRRLGDVTGYSYKYINEFSKNIRPIDKKAAHIIRKAVKSELVYLNEWALFYGM